MEWIKGEDWIDGQPRYYLEPYAVEPRWCDSFTSELRWCAVVVGYRTQEYPYGPTRRFYEAAVHDCRMENCTSQDRFKTASQAKAFCLRELAVMQEEASQ